MSIHCQVSCQQCHYSSLCVASALAHDEKQVFDQQVKRKKPLHRGQFLFESGDSFTSLYIVRSGALKVFNLDDSGDEQVLGFYFPGDLVGLDAIHSNQYVNYAIALDTTAICEIPYSSFEQLSRSFSILQRQLNNLLSQEIQTDRDLRFLLNRRAQERIWTFLLNLSQRYESRGLSADRFTLPMTRADIANYLGLSVETVSRAITQIRNDGLLLVDGREIVLLDRTRRCENHKFVESIHPNVMHQSDVSGASLTL